MRALDFVRRSSDGAREGLCYANFALNDELYRPDTSGRPHIRLRLAERLKDAPWVTLDVSQEQRSAPDEMLRYYAQLVRHKFVLSPQGRGIDCCRTWESLYLGAIPVVVESAPMSAFRDLPILFTDDYGELSEEYLERRWREMSSRSFEIELLLKSWYSRRFLEAVATLRKPRFVCLWDDPARSPASVERALRSALCADL